MVLLNFYKAKTLGRGYVKTRLGAHMVVHCSKRLVKRFVSFRANGETFGKLYVGFIDHPTECSYSCRLNSENNIAYQCLNDRHYVMMPYGDYSDGTVIMLY